MLTQKLGFDTRAAGIITTVGFFIASFGIRKIWPVVLLFVFMATLMMTGLYFLQKSKKLKQLNAKK